MNLCNIGHNFSYELEKLIRIFLPFEKIKIYESDIHDTRCAIVCRDIENNGYSLSAELFLDGYHEIRLEHMLFSDEEDNDKLCERKLAVLLYKCFVAITDYSPPWGILTGVRPAKLFSRLCSELGEKKAEDYLEKELYVKTEKISLCRDAVLGENKIISLSKNNSFSLYVSIPFCPSRCSYCSFVSHSVDKAKRLIPEYVKLLCEEIRGTAAASKKLGLVPETVYIGGGTPTAISAAELEAVMNTISECFDLKDISEYTVEAGRPDTVTQEKLEVILRCGATRISINPQSMSDTVLEAIGRKHTAKQTAEAFMLAKKMGFNNINADLIAGLPTDTLEGFKDTLSRVMDFKPESITVHSLSMKRASALSVNGILPEISVGADAAKMVEYARDILYKNGIFPYYMYRQSKTVGNLENVGYARPGYECLYNVYIMDETHSIFACGASAVTKLREPGGNYIERIFNFKYPYEYINRFSEIKERKRGISSFYEKYPAY